MNIKIEMVEKKLLEWIVLIAITKFSSLKPNIRESVINLTKATTWPNRAWFQYEIYALFLKNIKCSNI